MKKLIFCIMILSVFIPGMSGAADIPKQKIKSTDEFLDKIQRLKWNYTGPYSSGRIDVSGDIELTPGIVIKSKAIPVPSECQGRSDCRPVILMTIAKDVRGISCIKSENILGKEYCISASIAQKTTVRLRGKLVDTHPWEFNFIPVLEIMGSSTTPCTKGQLLCSRDKLCWNSFPEYCRFCLELRVEECACRSEKGIAPDASACMYFVSGDVMCPGKCRNGKCTMDVSPDKCTGPCCQ
ncbi:MAG: hypothetical protein ACYDHW_12185 [Syntrophorhabdaceae bacterium]